MADKRIYELVTSAVRTGKFFVMDSNALTDAEKFDANALLDQTQADALYQKLADEPLAPFVQMGPYESVLTSETLLIEHTGVTNAFYEGNFGRRAFRVTCNYAWVQNGPNAPTGVFRLKLGTTTILSSVSVTNSNVLGKIVFEVGAINTLNSYARYLNIYNGTVFDQSSGTYASQAHGTGNGLRLYFHGFGDIEWTNNIAMIEPIGL